LLADRDRYIGETPSVSPPDAIVVSGDLVRGAIVGDANWRDTIRGQYEVAGQFLDQLTRRYLNGDRSRLIIIPGNHDACWNTSFNSMERVPTASYPRDVRNALLAPGSIYRWSWKERALYRIRDRALYQQRLSAFWDFTEGFYAGVSLPRPIDRNRGYQLFELDKRRIVLAAFDSTSGNDCFGYSGAISNGVVARCDLDLRDAGRAYHLRVAVWHHSIQGPPLREDYMDVTQVHEMIGLRFQLGLHGHQHVAAATTHYVHVSQSQAMAIVSAGSLCAGVRELPRGVNRQYNIIVINPDYSGARVYVREMAEGEQFSRKTNGAFLQGYVDLGWNADTDAAGRRVDSELENERAVILAAEDALSKNNPKAALAFLNDIPLPSGSYGRALAVQGGLQAEDWGFLARVLKKPETIEEVITLVSALIHLNDLDQALALLSSRTDIDIGTRAGLEDQIATKKLMKGT
jgi:3',5'-cyclic AMP phosphodiesterase CpdA